MNVHRIRIRMLSYWELKLVLFLAIWVNFGSEIVPIWIWEMWSWRFLICKLHSSNTLFSIAMLILPSCHLNNFNTLGHNSSRANIPLYDVLSPNGLIQESEFMWAITANASLQSNPKCYESGKPGLAHPRIWIHVCY